MSGFVAILSLDGAPVDTALLERMTEALRFRGPDAQSTWHQHEVGLGHALWRATPEAASERQPATLCGRLSIVADARIDARAELIGKLNFRGTNRPPLSLATPDVELILHAYDAWGESCLDHLLGDFSFAVWDAANRKLFCARDHIGVKPFFYARVANTLLVSNTLQVLRLHPAVSSRVSDLAIGDFLLFGLNWQAGVSAYEDIKKLAPAHLLSASGGDVRLSRYWSFPIEEPFRHRRANDLVHEFRALISGAVSDRLRTDRATIALSGGLDSPTLAVEATKQLQGKGALRGVTVVHDRMITDQERKYAGIVAQRLGIPLQFIVGDSYEPLDGYASAGFSFPEPKVVEDVAMLDDLHRIPAAHGPVMLTGHGGDAALAPSLRYFRGMRFFALLWGSARYFLSHGRHPRLGFRMAWLRWRGLPLSGVPQYPNWFEPSFESRANLRARWHEIMDDPSPVHPDRPFAYALVCQTVWSAIFQIHDAGTTRTLLEVRHPFMDLRVLRFLLRLPTLPWCADKELLRLAIRNDLPEEILRRPKTPLAGEPLLAMLKAEDLVRMTSFDPDPEFGSFVVRDRISARITGQSACGPGVQLRPLSLNLWLQSRSSFS